MKKETSVLSVLIAVFFMAAFVSVASILFYAKLRNHPESLDDHTWIHSHLGLTEAQEKEIEPIEHHYHEQCLVLEAKMRDANKELAAAILADGQDSQRVQDAIAKIHLAMGELQSVTIGHVFAMKKALTPAQYDKLLHMTADALGQIDAEHAHAGE